jgi:hypothetical protein
VSSFDHLHSSSGLQVAPRREKVFIALKPPKACMGTQLSRRMRDCMAGRSEKAL